MKQPISDRDPLPELTKIIEQRVRNKGSTPWWFLGRLEEVCRAALPELLAARVRITELEAERTQPLTIKKAAKLERIREWAAQQTCDNFYRTGILDARGGRVCGDPTCGSCSARALGSNKEPP